MSNIKVLVVDVDGTLTDGIYTVSEDGYVSKSFHTKDFAAMSKIQAAGIDVIILTQARDTCIAAQYKRLPQASKTRMLVTSSVDDKKAWLDHYLEYNKLSWDDVAYIGDSSNDIECLEASRIRACPIDSENCVKLVEDIMELETCGGKGAVYELCEFLLDPNCSWCKSNN